MSSSLMSDAPTKPRQILTAEQARQVLHYCPDTGAFRWKVAPNGRITVGQIAGAKSRKYIDIKIGRKSYKAHRVAWLMHYGAWPEAEMIDHINGNPIDNRICNLRQASRSLNMQNRRGPAKSCKTGLLGVTETPYGRYRADLRLSGKHFYLGAYTTPELAHAAYVEAKRRLHAGCTI